MQCAGDSIFVNPYFDDCNKAACRQNGGEWTGTACACSDGGFINQFFGKCSDSSQTPPPSTRDAGASDFGSKCSAAGGEYTGTACQCAGDSIFVNPYFDDCNKAACRQNGGNWTGSACGCTDGLFINQFFGKCSSESQNSTDGGTSDFGAKCTAAGGDYTGTACKCAGDSIFVNPYFDDCNKAACRQNGGEWTGSACGCADGMFINQFFGKCSGGAATPPPDGTGSTGGSSDFGAKCTEAGGDYTGTACKCAGDSIFANPYVDHCNVAACRQNGGDWTGSACSCADGRFINQFFDHCTPAASSTDSSGSSSGDFSSTCTDAGGEYTGTACQCPGENIFTNPYASDCNTSACRQNGGDWTGSACGCSDGSFINQFFTKCPSSSGGSSSGTGDEFTQKCTAAGGEYTGSACKCSGTNIYTNPYVNDCNTASCVQNGGEWTGSACRCGSGTYINQFFDRCQDSPVNQSTDPPPSTSSGPTEFESKCTDAGGTYTGSACKCAESIFTNPYAQNCSTTGCIQNGGSWDGSSCNCSNGSTIDPLSGSCSGGSTDQGGEGAFSDFD